MTIERAIKMSEIQVLFTTSQLHQAESGGKDLVQINILQEQLQFYLYVNAILNDYQRRMGGKL